jgi:hypothetical protein
MGQANSDYEFIDQDGKQRCLDMKFGGVVFMGTTLKARTTGCPILQASDMERVKLFLDFNSTPEKFENVKALWKMLKDNTPTEDCIETILIRARNYGARQEIYFPRTYLQLPSFKNDLTPKMCTALVDNFDRNVPYPRQT